MGWVTDNLGEVEVDELIDGQLEVGPPVFARSVPFVAFSRAADGEVLHHE